MASLYHVTTPHPQGHPVIGHIRSDDRKLGRYVVS